MKLVVVILVVLSVLFLVAGCYADEDDEQSAIKKELSSIEGVSTTVRYTSDEYIPSAYYFNLCPEDGTITLPHMSSEMPCGYEIKTEARQMESTRDLIERHKRSIESHVDRCEEN